MNNIKIGDKVKDTVSGFAGTAIAIHMYLNGCNRISVQPKVNKDGTLPAFETFDDMQLEVKQKNKLSTNNETGGPEKYMPGDRPQ